MDRTHQTVDARNAARGGRSGATGGRSRWTRGWFLHGAEDWLADLRRDVPLDEVRKAILDRVNAKHFRTYEDEAMHDLDRVVVRDCARAWRGLLNPRSERLAGFSVLQALVDAAKGARRPDLSPAFWAEVCHLVDGIEGRVRLHEGDSLTIPQGVTGRRAARRRSTELDRLGEGMDQAMARFEDGLSRQAIGRRAARQRAILAATGGTARDWNDWHWQLRHIARDADALAGMAALSPDELARVRKAGALRMPFGVTPYYAALFDPVADGGRDRAIRAQVLPPDDYLGALEDEGCAVGDYMRETDTSPVDLVTRRYAAIVILKPYNACPQICVYCQRNWEIQGPMARGAMAQPEALADAIAWLRAHPAVHEVLVTGGDPLVMTDAVLKSVLDAVAAIPHVERIRIGTRTPVTLPMRFTPALCRLLGSYRVPGRREVCVVTHVEHPYEVTPATVQAVDRLRRQGIPVYNQLVYTFFVSRRFEAAALRRLLRRCGVDPYYTFNTKGKGETAAYRVPIARLVQEQKEEARLLPGMARTDEPVYNVPGLGKNHLNAWQHRDLISVGPDGARVYEFHPWEKKIGPQRTYVGHDVPILEYLDRLRAIGEDPAAYSSIWFYY